MMQQSYEFYSTSSNNPFTILPILISLSVLHLLHTNLIISYTDVSGEQFI